jgi:hypothetical protein
MDLATKLYCGAASPPALFPGGRLRNAHRETGTNNRGRLVMMTDKKGDGTVMVANPNLGGAGVEIESAFFADLGGGVGRGKNLDANVGRKGENIGILGYFGPVRCEPGNVDGLDTVSGGHRAFRQGLAVREEGAQEADNVTLAARMRKSRRRTHDDAAVPIGLDLVWELGQKRVGQDLGPTGEIGLRLRIQIRELDFDGH